jgi:hypothetical protein
MNSPTAWYLDVDPETGGDFVTSDPYYTWASGWGFFEQGIKGTTGDEYIELVPAVPSLGEGALFNYARVRIPVSDDPEEPRPRYLRPLSVAPMVTLMLHIIADDRGQTLQGPFVSGLVKRGVQARYERYLMAINGGAPTDFAIVVREEAERLRKRKETSGGETEFMKRLFYDMAKEVELAMGLTQEQSRAAVRKAFGLNPFERSTVRMRKPKPPKGEKK